MKSPFKNDNQSTGYNFTILKQKLISNNARQKAYIRQVPPNRWNYSSKQIFNLPPSKEQAKKKQNKTIYDLNSFNQNIKCITSILMLLNTITIKYYI